MTPRAQKRKDSYSSGYSTEGREGIGGARAGATEEAGQQLHAQLQYSTDHPSVEYYPTDPCARKRGEQQHLVSVSMKSGFVNGLAEVWKIGGFARVLRDLGACFAGISSPVHSWIRPLLAVKGLLWSGASYAGAAAAVTVSEREWWAVGIGLFGGAVLCWLIAGVVVVLGRLQRLFESKPPGVINVTPPGKQENWLSELENGSAELALLAEQPNVCATCTSFGRLQWCSVCSASKAGAR